MRVISAPIDERPDFVISLAQIAVNTYAVAKGRSVLLGDIIFGPLRFIVLAINYFVRVIVSIISFVILIFLTAILIVVLLYGNSLFYLMNKSIIEGLKKMDKRDLINKHLKFERSLRTLNEMKRSKFLFKTPLLGELNNSFVKNVEILESELKLLAYPNLFNHPIDIPIHKLDAHDPWQDDLEEYKSEVFTVS